MTTAPFTSFITKARLQIRCAGCGWQTTTLLNFHEEFPWLGCFCSEARPEYRRPPRLNMKIVGLEQCEWEPPQTQIIWKTLY